MFSNPLKSSMGTLGRYLYLEKKLLKIKHFRHDDDVVYVLSISVAHPDPPDPYHFPGSGSISKVVLDPDPYENY